jgi:hypothetical protein
MSANYFLMLNEEPWAGPVAFRVSGSDAIMNRGRRLKSPPGPLTYELRVDKKAKRPQEFPPLDWHNAPDGQALFSERLVSVLTAAGVANVDYYDATVHYTPTKAALKYKVSNVIGIASVLDRSKSRFNADEDDFIIELLSISLDESLCAGQKMFRFQERPSMLVISSDIKTALEGAAITGTLIIEPQDWEPGLI